MISGFLKLLERQYAPQLDEDAQQYIWYAVDGAKRMRAMLEALLEYSRIGTRGRPFAPTDCTMVLEQTLDGLRLLIEEDNAQVTYDALPVVMADEIQLERVFQNLVVNALKFQPKQDAHQPCVHIAVLSKKVEMLDYKRAASAFPVDSEVWLFSVQDNGIGIKSAQMGQLFKVFQRLHTREEYPGTGIGLASCKKIVERHGGMIWANSEWGQGTTFYFVLPKHS
jgi:light-regulated signal transduction histidine kinase (bacteriophytochrome)